MSTGDTDIELIERFISDKLTQTELEDFETRLEEDHEFARKFRLRKTFPSLFKAEGQDEIAMSVTATPAEKPKKKKAHSLKTGIWFWVEQFYSWRWPWFISCSFGEFRRTGKLPDGKL